MSAVDALNASLGGSPYSLNNDERGAARAGFLQGEMELLEERHRRVEEHFALQSEEVHRRIRRMTGARLVFESNALELTGLPLSETQRAIDEAPADSDQLAHYLATRVIQEDRHLIDVLGLHQANLFAHQLAAEYTNNVPIREVDIRSLHARTVPTERFRGEYRRIEVGIAGSGHTPPSVLEVPLHMHSLVEWIKTTNAPPPLAAAVAHSWLTIIHPFEDGNGRVARLLANVLLLRAAWPALIIRGSDRLQYLDALSASDEAGDLLPLFDLFIKSIRRGLKELDKPDLAERLYEADLKRQPDLQYRLWADGLTTFLDELRSLLRSEGFALHRLAVPSDSTYLLLCERDPTGNTWLAKLEHPDGRDFLLWLGFMSHQMNDYGTGSVAPSLFISERDYSREGLHPYRSPMHDGSPIEIDEVSILPSLSERPALIRYGELTVEERTIADAAAALASALVNRR